MQHSSLTSFLNGERSAEELWREIEVEVTEGIVACAKHGSGPVIISDGPETQISRQHLAVLISALAEEKLPIDAAAYVADAMIMSDDFAWDDKGIADALFRLADQSAPLTMGDIDWAGSRISTAP